MGLSSSELNNKLDNIPTVTLSSSGYCRRYGKVVDFSGYGITAKALTGYTIPSGYRPTKNYSIPAVLINTGTGDNYTAYVIARSTGGVDCRWFSPAGKPTEATSASYDLYFTGMWITA